MAAFTLSCKYGDEIYKSVTKMLLAEIGLTHSVRETKKHGRTDGDETLEQPSKLQRLGGNSSVAAAKAAIVSTGSLLTMIGQSLFSSCRRRTALDLKMEAQKQTTETEKPKHQTVIQASRQLSVFATGLHSHPASVIVPVHATTPVRGTPAAMDTSDDDLALDDTVVRSPRNGSRGSI